MHHLRTRQVPISNTHTLTRDATSDVTSIVSRTCIVIIMFRADLFCGPFHSFWNNSGEVIAGSAADPKIEDGVRCKH